jgi:hypothetical protein
VSACCSSYDRLAGAHFDATIAKRDLENYRTKGQGAIRRGDFLEVASAIPPASIRAAIGGENGLRRLKGDPFRAFVHPGERMTEMIERGGFRLAGSRQTWQWSADVWVRGPRERRLD